MTHAGGYKLFLSEKNKTGYLGVYANTPLASGKVTYSAKETSNMHRVIGSHFQTAVDAAVAFAKDKAEKAAEKAAAKAAEKAAAQTAPSATHAVNLSLRGTTGARVSASPAPADGAGRLDSTTPPPHRAARPPQRAAFEKATLAVRAPSPQCGDPAHPSKHVHVFPSGGGSKAASGS